MTSEQQSHAAALWSDAKSRDLIGQMRRFMMNLEAPQSAYHFLLTGEIGSTPIGSIFPLA
jgi:hypothetical protein